VQAVAAGLLNKTLDELLLPALRAPPEQVGCLGPANTYVDW
jgi:hypothetical protein